ncbi:MAG: UDP-N-acetylmuramate dehydrogenase [Bacillaceae bacterium]|nr:UDP-N-acetylmuramate dehydrogenase [Bacillaceae bacterium]
MRELVKHLKEANVGTVLENEPLSNHTTWKIGGPADVLIIPGDKDGLVKSMKLVHEHQVPWFVIGKGSNLLIRDGGIRGVVFKLAEGLNHLRFEGERIHVGAGYSFIRLAIMAGKMGLKGLEFAGGIPGTVGGAIFMNAGAHGSDVSRILVDAEILLADGELKRFTGEELEFQYRTSVLQTKIGGIVTEVTFQLQYGDRKEIAAAMASYKDRRMHTQPLKLPCAGSVFRNPQGDYAGRLIESAGLKGYRVGDAQISDIHANFIVNHGNARARDVLSIIEHVKRTIKEKYDIDMVPEVRVVGEE